MPVRPTVSADVISWDVPSGDRVRVAMLLPRQRNVSAIDEAQLWAKSVIRPEQLKWQVRVTPASQLAWTTFLNVIDVHRPGEPSTSQLVTSAEDDVQGAMVRRPGNMDFVALFNAAPGPALRAPPGRDAYDPVNANLLRQVRLRRTGFTIQWTSVSPTADVFVADLDPSRSWHYKVDSGPAIPLMLSSGGIGFVTVAGAARSHTLVVF
jgi:hypothetical protein